MDSLPMGYIEDLDFKEVRVKVDGVEFTAVRRYTSHDGPPILKLKDCNWVASYEFE